MNINGEITRYDYLKSINDGQDGTIKNKNHHRHPGNLKYLFGFIFVLKDYRRWVFKAHHSSLYLQTICYLSEEQKSKSSVPTVIFRGLGTWSKPVDTTATIVLLWKPRIYGSQNSDTRERDQLWLQRSTRVSTLGLRRALTRKTSLSLASWRG